MSQPKSIVSFALAACVGVLLSCDDGHSVSPADQGPGPASWVPDSLPRTGLVIEEVAPGNVDLLDERGEDPGWVELSNNDSLPVSLGAWRLRGEAGDGAAWRLPDTTLQPGERLLVFMSGLDRRQSVPAGDSLSAFNPNVYAWSDSLNDPPGHSSYGPWEFRQIRGRTIRDSLPAFSATLTLADNAETDLDWSSVNLTMPTPTGRTFDVSGRDRLAIRATIPARQRLVVRFCEEGQDCWNGSSVELEGTGDTLGVYDISLLRVATDFRILESMSFEPPSNQFGTYRFTVAGVRFFRSARRPHASFELHRKGGVLHLEDTSGTPSQVLAYPEMPATSSWSRVPGTRRYVVRERPTPEAANPADPPATTLPAPAFATATGFHAGPVLVRLGAVAGATVRCAENGGRLAASSRDASDGIRLDSTRVLSCAAFAPDGRMGPASTSIFIVGETTALPVVSLVADSSALFDSVAGVYMPGPGASSAYPYFGANFWRDQELPAHVEFFEPGGVRAFSAPAGVGIFGNWSRAAAKKPLSVQFREKYGVRRIDWPLFPQHPEFRRFKGFALRNNGGASGNEYVRDALAATLVEGRDLENQISRQVVVYLNGRYWGIHDMRERMDADYLDTRFGIDASQVDLLKNGGEVQAGSAGGWNSMIDWLLGADLADSANYARIKGMIDVDNQATYLASEIYYANDDWPANNIRSWRRHTPPTPWRMMLFDVDAGIAGFSRTTDMFSFLGDSSVVDDYPNGPRSTALFRRLSGNPVWRDRFVNRTCALLATNFSTARATAIYDSMLAAIASEVPRDQKRWGFSENSTRAQEMRIRSFLRTRPQQVRRHMKAWYGLADSMHVSLSGQGASFHVDGLPVGSTYRGTHFAGVPVTIRAVPTAGGTFAGWSDSVATPERTFVLPASEVELSATFR